MEQLLQDIAHDNVAHAYLLSGGTVALAKSFAKKLQCGCDNCIICSQIDADGFADVTIHADDGEKLKIKMVRDLHEYAYRSTSSKHKIVIIERIERMTKEAINAFLKLLEEPPQKTIFLLTAVNFRSVLPTIVSRARVVRFVDESSMSLDDTLATLLRERQLGPLFAAIEEIHKDKVAVTDWIDNAIHILRRDLISPESERPLSFDRMHLVRLLEALQDAKSMQKNNVNAKLLLENFCCML